MVELFGWLKIVNTHKDEDELSAQALTDIHLKTEYLLNKVPSDIKITNMNGNTFLSVVYCCNHKIPYIMEMIDFFLSIAKTADGSYGIIHLRDDEDFKYFNEIQTLILKRGKGTWVKDTYFSPCIPTLEDEVIL